MRFGLRQSNFAGLEEHLSKSSDPTPTLSTATICQRKKSRASETQSGDGRMPCIGGLKNMDWISSILKYSAAKDWIHVRLQLSKVEEMLDTKYHVFEHSVDGHRLIRAPSWSLPENLHGHIDVVQPTNSFFRLKKQRWSRHASPICRLFGWLLI